MNPNDFIERNPNIMFGKPLVRGTRLTAELMLRKLGEGATTAEWLDAYPGLTERNIQAAVLFAVDSIAHQQGFDLIAPNTAEGKG